MNLSAIVEIAKFALDAQSRMDGAAAGSVALSAEFHKKLTAGSLTEQDVKDWINAIQANVSARDDAATKFFGAVQLLAQVLQ